MIVDVFRAVVGMEADDDKRQLIQQSLQRGNAVARADPFDGTDNLALSDFIDGVDMIDPFCLSKSP